MDEPDTVSKVRRALAAAGSGAEVIAFPDGTASAVDAARAVGCDVAKIAKTIVFRSEAGPVLVVASGVNRVDRDRAAGALGLTLRGAGPDWVLAHTGFVAGGVAPVGHDTPPPVLIDADLAAQGGVWAAAGSPRHVFRTDAAELVRLTGGRIAVVRRED